MLSWNLRKTSSRDSFGQSRRSIGRFYLRSPEIGQVPVRYGKFRICLDGLLELFHGSQAQLDIAFGSTIGPVIQSS